MNTPSSPGNSPTENVQQLTVSRAELYEHLQAVINASWQEGLVFSLLFLSGLLLVVSVLIWNGNQYVYFGPTILLGLLFIPIHNQYMKAHRNLESFSGFRLRRKEIKSRWLRQVRARLK